MTTLFKVGDILNVKTGIIVHGCNTKGVMGSGLALQVKRNFPGAYRIYKEHLQIKGLGETIWYAADERLWIVNALTQDTYGRNPETVYVSYKAIQTCFDYIFKYAAQGDYSVHVPDMIGAGLGNGNRDKILAIIEDSASRSNFLNELTFWKYEVL